MPSIAADPVIHGTFGEVLDQGLETLKILLLTEHNKDLDQRGLLGAQRHHFIAGSENDEYAGERLVPKEPTRMSQQFEMVASASSSYVGPYDESQSSFSTEVLPLQRDVSSGGQMQGMKSMESMDHMSSDIFGPKVSFAVFNEETPEQRWARFVNELLRPSSRLSLGMIKSAHCMHEIWTNYLMKLRHNEAQSQKLYTSAVAKVTKGRGELEDLCSTGTMSNLFRSLSTPRAYAFIIHPDSYKRVFWIVLTLLVLLLDTVLVPIAVVFALDDDVPIFTELIWFSNSFWLLDIAVSCVSGRYEHGALEVSLTKVAMWYTRTWLPFDVGMVTFDWVLAIWEMSSGEKPMGSLGIILRCVRIVRLLRLVRLGSLRSVLRDNTAINNKGLILCAAISKITFAYGIYFHFLACVWYGIGLIGGNGWGSECKRSFNSGYCYFTALHWAITQLHGTSDIVASTTVEWAFSSTSQFFGLILLAFFLGRTGHAIFYLVGVDRMELRQRGIQYIKKHRLSSRLAHRFLRYIDAGQVDIGLQVRQEFEMLGALPLSLQAEILEEAIKPLLTRSIKIIGDLEFVSHKMVKRLCSEAIGTTICIGGEGVFATGDSGKHWRVVDDGFLVYISGTRKDAGKLASDIIQIVKSDGHLGKSLHHFQSRRHSMNLTASSSSGIGRSNAPSSLVSSVKSGSATSITSGRSVSEMVLWTPWTHTGDLISTNDSVLHHLSLEDFCSMIEVRSDACYLTSRYAQQFVKQLNKMQGDVSDLYQYRCFKREDSGDLGDYANHFAFLSHYKAEAGTEATLMQEGLSSMLEREGEDFYSDNPVFLDSIDLTDLSMIKDHVRMSKNLVLLLTPGVLGRPWCLVEIVTALAAQIPIVPVEIQRPGLQFQYPDEHFYGKLKKGEVLNAQALNLLLQEGISLQDVEDALRFVFLQITLPFSPHKSRGIREAELLDILRRCMPIGWRPRLSTEGKFGKSYSEASSSPARIVKRKNSFHTYSMDLPGRGSDVSKVASLQNFRNSADRGRTASADASFSSSRGGALDFSMCSGDTFVLTHSSTIENSAHSNPRFSV